MPTSPTALWEGAWGIRNKDKKVAGTQNCDFSFLHHKKLSTPNLSRISSVFKTGALQFLISIGVEIPSQFLETPNCGCFSRSLFSKDHGLYQIPGQAAIALEVEDPMRQTVDQTIRDRSAIHLSWSSRSSTTLTSYGDPKCHFIFNRVSLFQDCKWFNAIIFSFFHPGRIPVGWHPLELLRNFPFDEQSLPIDFVMPSEKARATATETSNSQGWLQSLVNGCKWLVYVSIWDRSKHIQSISWKGW